MWNITHIDILLEANASQIQDVLAAMQPDSCQPLTHLIANGGATHANFIMRFQAGILGVPVVHSRASDHSAMGAVYLARLATGGWDSLDGWLRMIPSPAA